MTQQLFDDTVLTDSDLPSADGYEWPVFGKQADLQLINMRGVDADDPQWETFMDQLTFNQLAKICANGLRMTIAINEIGKPETVDHNGPSGVTQKPLMLIEQISRSSSSSSRISFQPLS